MYVIPYKKVGEKEGKISHERSYHQRAKRQRSKPSIALGYSDKMLQNTHTKSYIAKKPKKKKSKKQNKTQTGTEGRKFSQNSKAKLEMSLTVNRNELGREWEKCRSKDKE